MKPLIQAVINSEFQTPRAHSLSNLLNQIFLGANIDSIPFPTIGEAGVQTWPQSEAIVVLRRGNNVLGARSVKQVGPMSRIEKLCPEAVHHVHVVHPIIILFVVSA